MRSRNFSLLEIMVGIALVLIAAGAIGWKMQDMIVKKRFKGDLERLKSRVLSIQALAVNMQADWNGILKFDGKTWTFEALCLDPPRAKAFSPMTLHVTDVLLDGKKQETYSFQFFSSGEVWPCGTFEFRSRYVEQSEKLDLPAILGRMSGDGMKKLGPVHPDETNVSP